MFKNLFLPVIIFFIAVSASAQGVTDSIVRFSDLKFSSGYEREAFTVFLNHKGNPFDLFLSIDDKITKQDADSAFRKYRAIIEILNQKNVRNLKMDKKIKVTYTTVHSLLTKYDVTVTFPEIFRTGQYNCLTASILFASVFDEEGIPYKIMASSNHVYLVANPGSKSTVIETTNPGFEKQILTGEFKQDYVNYLRSSKLISEDEARNKSVEELFEEKFNEVHEISFSNLPGMQYFNLSVKMFNEHKIENALQSAQKAYFFSPDESARTILYALLLLEIEKCDFSNVSDIDYLAQLSRINDVNSPSVKNLFIHILGYYLQYNDKEEYCNSLYNRLISEIDDNKLKEEISFYFYLQMSSRYINDLDKAEYYINKTLSLRSNFEEANILMEVFINKKFQAIHNSRVLLDSVKCYQARNHFECAQPMLKRFRSLADLKIARDLYDEGKISEGDVYINDFETINNAPVKDEFLQFYIENAYRSAATYQFFTKKNKTKAKEYLDHGLAMIPGSIALESCYNWK